MMRTRGWVITGLLLLMTACLDEGPQSGPGTVTGTIVGPNGPEGAARIGPGIGSVSPVGSAQLFVRSVPGATEIVIIHPTGGALAFEVAVADTTSPPATVIKEIADPDDVLRASLDAYSVDFSG